MVRKRQKDGNSLILAHRKAPCVFQAFDYKHLGPQEDLAFPS